MTFKPIALHSCLVRVVLVAVCGGLLVTDPPPAFAQTPQPRYRGKEPRASAANPLELMDEEAHSSPAAETRGQLMVALGEDDLGAVRRLLEDGADVNQPFSESGQTPLMAAESLAMATLLRDRGGQVQARDADGGTVLHYAVSRAAALDLVRYFVAQGADINARGWDNETPLFAAVSYFNERDRSGTATVWTGEDPAAGEVVDHGPSGPEVIALLVELGADINAVDAYGNTVLMQCAVADDGELVETLLKLGAGKELRNTGGDTAKDIAYELGHRYIYQLLD